MSKELAAAAERLADLLSQENAALKRLDFAAAVALIPAKEAALADLGTQPRAPVAAALGLLRQRLNALAKENQTLLEHAIAVQTRVVRIVARAGSMKPVVVRYGSHATAAPMHRASAIALFTRA